MTSSLLSAIDPPQSPPEVPSVPPPGHGEPAGTPPAAPPEIDTPVPAENPVPVHEVPGMPPMTA